MTAWPGDERHSRLPLLCFSRCLELLRSSGIKKPGGHPDSSLPAWHHACLLPDRGTPILLPLHGHMQPTPTARDN